MMNTIFYVFLLAFSVLLSGCRQLSQPPEEKAPEKEAFTMIQIQKFIVSEETLTLDYKVSNPFPDDIRVCQDTSAFGRQHVVTRIDDETVWIKLRFNIEMDKVLRNPEPIAKYLRLAPGESCSDRILLNLPIRNASPVNDFPEEDRKKRKQIVIHRAVLEVGYFGGKFGKFFDVLREQMKQEEPVKGELIVVGGLHYITSNPLIVEEMRDSKSRELVYVRAGWASLGLEESAKLVVTDVDIPCSIAVDQ